MEDMTTTFDPVPSLTLSPDLELATPTAPVIDDVTEKPEESVSKYLETAQLTPAEVETVNQFSEQINLADTSMVLNYGAAAQKHIADFSSNTLASVQTKDMGEVGDMLTNLTVELKGLNFDESETKGFFGLFKKGASSIAKLKAQYDSAEKNVDSIVGVLENHQVVLLKDVAMLDKMYELNKGYFKELTMYIMAGKKKLESTQANELKALQDKAVQTGLPEDAQAANDLANKCNRFEKKIHDLELTRIISIQMAPQIRMIQNNDAMMLEKIQTSIVNTIPLWKSQMVLAISLHHSQQSMEAQRAVTDVTNELLIKNSEKLKTGSVEIAKESERGIVDLETLVHTNQNLIDTLEEVRQIQVEGHKSREAATAELAKIEGELKQKLLALSTSNLDTATAAAPAVESAQF